LQLIAVQQAIRRCVIPKPETILEIFGIGSVGTPLRSAGPGLKEILRGIHSDAIKPGIESAIAPEPLNRAKRFNKGFLGQVHHFLVIVDVPTYD
jgi:hypothetical protein